MGKNQLVVRIGKYAIALCILILMFFLVDLQTLFKTVQNISIGNFTYLIIISLLLVYISALKWGLFLDSFGVTVSALRLSSLYLVGYFVNLVFPSYVGGDVVRSWYIGRTNGHHDVATATILERYTGLLAMMIFALFSISLVDLASPQVEFIVLSVALALLIGSFAALRGELITVIGSLPLIGGLAPHLKKIQLGLRLAASKPKLLIGAMSLSFLFHCFTVLNTVAAGWAVGWYDINVPSIFIVLPIILLVGALPITPGGLGLQEGAFLFFLVQVGATPEQALGVGLILRAKSYLLSLAGWFCWISVRDDKK